MATKVEVEEGKYTVLIPEDWEKERFECLRYGQSWRDLCGDGMVLALCYEILKLRGDKDYQ